MSHVATIELQIKDLDALERACKTLGLELVRGQESYRWYGHHVGDYPLPAGFSAADLGKCNHAIRIPGVSSYEVGVVQRGDSYTLLWDFYGSQGRLMQDHIGASGIKLQDQYAAQVSISQLQSEGYSVNTWTNDQGEIIVEATQ